MKNGVRDPVTEQLHPSDVPMKCGSDSEMWVCELDALSPHHDKEGCRDLKEKTGSNSTLHAQTMDVQPACQFDDAGMHAPRSSTPQTLGPVTPMEKISLQMLDSSSERSASPCDLRALYKRKLGFPGAEVVELGQRKRQCVVSMEDEQEDEGSPSEPC